MLGVTRRRLINDIPAQQAVGAEEAFIQFFNQQGQQFDHVIEIGTDKGGWSAWLYEQSKRFRYEFETIDNAPHLNHVVRTYGDVPFKFTVEDILSHDGVHALTQYLESLEGRILLLCDGDDKVMEVNIFTKALKSDDVVMCHDYAHTREFHKTMIRNVTWNWCEITLEDINLSELGLMTIEEDLFDMVAWGCFLKAY